MPRLTADKWADARAEYEAGLSAFQVGVKFGVSHTAVNKKAIKEGWTQDIEPIIRRKVSERVSGIVSGEIGKKKTEAMEAEAERRAEIERRHRDEPNECRERIHSGLKSHKAAVNKEDKQLAFEDLKAAKIASEAMQIVHNMERKAWRLDTYETAPHSQPHSKVLVEIKKEI